MNLFGEVIAAYMEEPPLIAEWDRLTHCPNVLVLPFFIADGLHSYQDIPVLLGIEEEGQPRGQPARNLSGGIPIPRAGRQLYYASAIGTEPMMGGFDSRSGPRPFDAVHGS